MLGIVYRGAVLANTCERFFCAEKRRICDGKLAACTDCPRTRSGKDRTHTKSSAARGYDRYWQTVVRPYVLRMAGISEDQWHLYDVDHNPPYDPQREPNHWAYSLVPRLHADHSRKTAARDGGFGNREKPVMPSDRPLGGVKSLQDDGHRPRVDSGSNYGKIQFLKNGGSGDGETT